MLNQLIKQSKLERSSGAPLFYHRSLHKWAGDNIGLLRDEAVVSQPGWPPSPGLSGSGKVRRARHEVTRPPARQNTLRPRSPGLRGL
jgi:hypothetical protein